MTGLQLAVENAPLPKVYEAACTALAECYAIDECKDWADKAAALASYAKQRDDETMLNTAKRIKGRAIKRIGQLLLEIEASKGGRPPKETGGCAPTSLTRNKAAREAGLSRDQQVTAIRVASVPDRKFDELIEADNPATITKIAGIGTKTKPKPLVDFFSEGITEYQFRENTKLMGLLNAVVRDKEGLDIGAGVKGTMGKMRPRLLSTAMEAKRIIDEIVEKLSV